MIAIHTNPFQSIDDVVFQKCVRLIYEFAVPFFFVTQGFFLERSMAIINDEKNRGQVIEKSIRKMFKYYVIWEMIYFPFTVMYYRENSHSIITNIIDYVHNFLLMGKFEQSFHLWYLIASIWAATFIWLSNKLHLGDIILDVVAVVMFITATILQDRSGYFSTAQSIQEASGIYYKIFGSGGGYYSAFYTTV